jgi:hypothetical protein
MRTTMMAMIDFRSRRSRKIPSQTSSGYRAFGPSSLKDRTPFVLRHLAGMRTVGTHGRTPGTWHWYHAWYLVWYHRWYHRLTRLRFQRFSAAILGHVVLYLSLGRLTSVSCRPPITGRQFTAGLCSCDALFPSRQIRRHPFVIIVTSSLISALEVLG